MAFRQNRWFLLLLLLVPVNFILGIDRNALTVSSALVKHELGIDSVLMSEIVVISTAVYALLQVPAGWFTHKIGVRVALSGACLLWSLATIATSFQTHLTGFFGVRILLGIGQAPDWVACIFALKLLFSEKEREQASSLLLGGLYIGYTVSGVLTAHVIQAYGWRTCFVIYGVVGLVFSALIFLLYGGPSLESHVAKPAASAAPVAQTRVGLLPIMQIAIFYAGVCSVQSFYSVTFPHFMATTFHLSTMEIGNLFSVPWASLYISVLLAGIGIRSFKRKETPERPFRAAPVRVFGIVAAAAFLAAGMMSPYAWLSMVLFVLSMSCVGLCQVLTWSHVQSFPRGTGVVAGVTALMGNGMSSGAPVIAEIVYRDQQDWMPVAALAIVYGLIAASMWFIPAGGAGRDQREVLLTPGASAELEQEI